MCVCVCLAVSLVEAQRMHLSCFCTSLVVALASGKNHTATPDPSTSFGTWEGWGTSLCWWANVFGSDFDNDLANLLFSTKDEVTVNSGKDTLNLPGLGLTIARYNAGGSSEAPDERGEHMDKSPNMRAGGEVEGFWLDWGSADPKNSTCWDWSKDANQVAMLQKARDAAGADFIAELFSNSPMW